MATPLNFKVSSALKNIIGKDLITDDNVAIFELVKNSYDAGAENVEIIFQQDIFEKGNDKIFIIDDGKGMSYDDIINKWLFVAYSAKNDGTEDVERKTYAGNKGVGRFSCDRLGAKLKLQTKTESAQKINILDVSWGKFESNSKDLFSQIDILHSESPTFQDLPNQFKNLQHGVVLEMTLLRDEESWNRDKLLKLKRHLAKLIDPFGSVQNNFKIKLTAEYEEEKDAQEALSAEKKGSEAIVINGLISNTIFETIKNKTTSFTASISKDGLLTCELIDRGQLIYKTAEPSKFPLLFDSDFSIEVYYLNASAKQTFARRMSMPSVKYGSLMLFRNGFRVFPVGEPGSDSWGMDVRKGQGYARFLGSRDLIGRVSVYGGEDQFKESTSRDQGLINTAAYQELYDCTWACVKKLEKYVVGITWKDVLDKDNDTLQRMSLDENRQRIITLVRDLANSDEINLLEYNEDLVSVLSEKSRSFQPTLDQLSELAEKLGNKDLEQKINEAEKRFDQLNKQKLQAEKLAEEEAEARFAAQKIADKERLAREQIEQEKQKVDEAYKEEKKRNLFFTSQENKDKDKLESFLHQIILYAANSKMGLEDAIKRQKSQFNPVSKEEMSSLLENTLEATDKIITTSRFATSADFRLDSANITTDLCNYIEQYLQRVCTAYQRRIAIVVEPSTKEFVTKFTPIELGMVFDNLVSNASKSRANQIKFTLNIPSKGILEIVVTDNGRGLDKNILEPQRIFEKGFTKSRQGSGLGLHQAKQYLSELGGDISISENQPARGMSFTIRIVKNEN